MADSLFPASQTHMGQTPRHTTGILPYQALKELIRNKEIMAAAEFSEQQVQPASVDLRLGSVAYRVRASFLPGEGYTVKRKIDLFGMHKIDLAQGAVLEKGCVYIAPLLEYVALSSRISGLANPKSSVGRLDIFTRLITDHASEFDRIRPGYAGPLYAEISPRTFSIVVRQGSRLNQLRVRRGSPSYSDAELFRLQEQLRLVDRPLEARHVQRGLPVTVDLSGEPGADLIGFRAKKHADLIDLDRIAHYDPLDYWEPIAAGRERAIILNPDDFYVLASKEAVNVPPDHAAEMVAYDTLVGEFRVHYAGFFDPGFGHAAEGAQGTRAVLEVRSHDVPFMIEDGQLVGRLVYERLTDVPDKLYGPAIGSSYQRQGLQLSKQFKPYG
ncbi:MAG TPA: 2'-deoxycytidine 5'-triphosphate deaminase [Alphaproteobacteria bacterium]|nr:2'-deoxycytidine 5'-triphosphate deaminase [Alphaproteobacteria bacterium]